MEALRSGDPRRVGRYRLLGRLGVGGMGQVFLGRSPGGTLVAVKLVHSQLVEDPDFRARFRREVGAARAVSGAFTAPVVDADPEAGLPWLATAYLPGVPLDQAVPLPVPAVFALGAGLAEALVSIHRAGVVHRDLKPSNVMLGADGPRVIDFGIAHAADAAVVTQAGSATGSPGFVAPEQARGGWTGPAADVFSLGAVLVFAATGVGPYGMGPPHVLIYRAVHERPRLDGVTDPALRAVVEACLDQDPERRPDPGELLRLLAAHVPQSTDLHGVGWLPATVGTRIVQAGADVPDRPRTTLGMVDVPGRRRFLMVGGAAAAVALGTGGVAALVRAVREPSGGSGPRTPAASPVTSSAPAPMRDGKVLWKRFSGDEYLISTPMVAGGSVFVGSEKGNLLAFDARTGKPRWKHRTGRRIITGPAAASGLVYALSQDGVLYAVDARTGRVRWRRTVGDTQADPVVAGGLVYSGGDAGYALDAATGSVRWRGSGAERTPAAAGGVVYVPRDKSLVAYDASSGRTRWTYASPKGVHDTAAADGIVCFADFQGEKVHAVDARTGKRRWTFDVGETATSRPVMTDRMVYVCDYGGKVSALDRATGTMRWQAQLGEGQIQENPVLAGGTLYVPSGVYSDGSVYAVDAGTGRKVWRFQAGDGIESGPAVADGIVYTGCKDGYLYALDARGGSGTATD